MTGARWVALAAVLAGGGTPVALPGSAVAEDPRPASQGQVVVERPAAADTLGSVEEILQRGLEDVATAFAWAWNEGDAERLESHMAPSPQRIRLQLGPTRHGALTRRQATAALRDVLATRREHHSEVEQVTVAGGNPERGFAEVVWSSVPRGTSQRVTYTVYVGFLRLDDEWRVLEVRVLR